MMTNRLRLTHLTMTGPAVAKASVEFDAGLTVIYGASDTGKSYIAQAIDYMLGGKRLMDEVPEADGYTQVMLGLILPDGSPVTFVRSVTGGRFNVYFSELHDAPAGPPDQSLSVSSRAKDNLSQYLLGRLGIVDAQIRKNAQNQCQRLSFRNIARLCVIDETSMQSKVSPTLSGQFVTETAEKSVFKFLVEGTDDGEIAATEESADQRKVSKGKADLLTQVIADLEALVTDSPELQQLIDQHARVRAALDSHSDSVSEIIARRDQLVRERDSIRSSIEKDHVKLSEVENMFARFSLLRQQYESDLARLEMVAEAGDLLGYFDRGICVFCGAALEDQRMPSMHVASEATELSIAIMAERTKTEALHADLATTLTDVQRQAEDLRSSLRDASRAADSVEEALAAVQQELAPKNELLSQLLDTRSNIEHAIGVYEQIDRMHSLREELLPDEVPILLKATQPMSGTLTRLSGSISPLLSEWGVPDGHPVDFDLDEYDLIAAGRPRRSRGKGVRAILHAAYTLGLAEYCDAAGLPHPGFVVLDSPLITYRGPEGTLPLIFMDDDDEHVSASVAVAFFRYLARSHRGQVVVLENTDPPDDISGQAKILFFTGRTDVGRYGFFPR
jgi:hypothetical protein